MATLPAPLLNGVLHSVQVGQPRTVTWRGDELRTAIWKAPVHGRVPVRGVNLVGDDQADRTVHGGPDKAVYAYGLEDLRWWSEQLGTDLAPGTFGENLTVSGIPVSNAVVGERWHVGSALLEVCQPRLPCFKLGVRMSDAAFPKRFGRAGRPGAYLRIIQEGEVGAGDRVEVVSRPAHGVTVALVSTVLLHDHSRAAELLAAPELPAHTREWAADRAAVRR